MSVISANRAVDWIKQAPHRFASWGDRRQADRSMPRWRDRSTDAGLGLDGAWQRFAEVVAPNNIGLDSERFLAFIPLSPSVASVWMDTIVSAGSFPAESWLEGAGAVAAENQVIDLLCRAAGMPAGAAGCFMSGGSIGNLSALAVGRERAGGRRLVAVADTRTPRSTTLSTSSASSRWWCTTGPDCRLTGDALRAAIGEPHRRRHRGRHRQVRQMPGSSTIWPVAPTSPGRSAPGIHVDGAYGLAALLLPELAGRFAGLDQRRFVHRRSAQVAVRHGRFVRARVSRAEPGARHVHTQHGPYIDVLRTADDAYNPCDLGYQLTRRASGLPIWFALALHGVDAHRTAIRRGIAAGDGDGRRARQAPFHRADHAARTRRGVVPTRRMGS